MRDIAARRVRLVEVESPRPSPFARSLLFGYVAQFLYEGDSPLAERRAAALSLDPALLAELLGTGEGLALRDLLDADQIERTAAELQRLTPERACRDAEDVADLLRSLGPLPTDAVRQRSRSDASTAEVGGWLVDLEGARRVIRVGIGGLEHWAAVEDAARLRDALGCSLPTGIPQVFLDPVTDPLGDLVARYARTHGPFRVAELASHFALGPAVAHAALVRLAASARVVEGEFLPAESGASEFCDAEVLRLLRRRSLASLRAEVEPVTTRDLARFLPGWQGVGEGLRGREGLLRAVEQLSGAALPASALETLVLPSRVVGYTPALLDEVMAEGEVLWAGHGPLAGDDGWVSLHLAETAPLTLTAPGEAAEVDLPLLRMLSGGGAYFFRTLAEGLGSTDDAALVRSLWDLVWAGRVTGDTFAPVRALLAGGRNAHRPARSGPRPGRYAGRRGSLGALGSRAARPSLPVRSGPPTAVGRWSALPERDLDPTRRAYAVAEQLLDRHGVLTRGAVAAEDVVGGFAAVYRVLAAAEEAGRIRRGYFVESLGAAQFGTTGAIDRLRGAARGVRDTDRSGPSRVTGALVLAACDPANPFGAALPWPVRPARDLTTDDAVGARSGHQPGRKAGALVVVVDGELVLYVERGGRTLLSWGTDPAALQAGADALALAVREGALGRLTVEKADGDRLLGSDHPLVAALEAAGFRATPRGLRLRR